MPASVVTVGPMLSTKGYRVASKAKGDDVSRARFVRVAQEPGAERKRRLHKPRLPGFESPFILEGRAKFPKSVKAPDANILVSGHNNIKIGRDVRKGHLRGYWIYTLSLEERKTCPSSCQHWQSCYGNNMPFAKRVDHADPDFLKILETAVDRLCTTKRKGRTGVLIRLHALGDFFSASYVGFWRTMLRRHTNLSLYGYTAHRPASDIGIAITDNLNSFGTDRALIRFSNGGLATMSTVSIGRTDSVPEGAFICPEQTGKTLGCDHCALCWATTRNVAFLEH